MFRHPENATPADDLSAFYQWSTDLQAFHADGATEGATTVDFSASANDPLTGTTTVTATITGASPDSLFVRLGVTQNP